MKTIGQVLVGVLWIGVATVMGWLVVLLVTAPWMQTLWNVVAVILLGAMAVVLAWLALMLAYAGVRWTLGYRLNDYGSWYKK